MRFFRVVAVGLVVVVFVVLLVIVASFRGQVRGLVAAGRMDALVGEGSKLILGDSSCVGIVAVRDRQAVPLPGMAAEEYDARVLP